MLTISVIVPVFNTEKYLPRCLDSILNQTFSDMEIICINDGSTDNSAGILEEYAKKDSRIKIISQENQGLSVTRNIGLKIATGKYVSFIDSDDWIDREYYETLVDLLESSCADIAMAGMRTVRKQVVSDNSTPKIVSNRLYEKISCLANGSVCDKLFKIDLFRKNEITFPENRYFEDNIVLIKCMYFADVVAFTNHVSYYYFMNDNGICRGVSPVKEKKRNQDKLYISEQIISFANSKGISGRDLYEIKLFTVRAIAADLIRKGSEFFSQATDVFGKDFIHKLKTQRLLNKLERFFYRKGRYVKVLKIPIKKIRNKSAQPCQIGAYSYYGEGFAVFNRLSHIGKYCSIGRNVTIGTSSHFVNFLTTSPVVTPGINFMNFPEIQNQEWIKCRENIFDIDPLFTQEPVSIGNDVWIGNNVIIMDGLRIGHGAIIGAGAVVTKDVPPYAIVCGVPAKVLRYRFDPETIKSLLMCKWWNKSPDLISKLPYHDVMQCINEIQ